MEAKKPRTNGTGGLPSSAFDFRSDTVTVPSSEMLATISSNASKYGDDVYGEDEPTNSLEKYVCSLTGVNHSLFVLSGTMGNQLALRSALKQPPFTIICHRYSHLFEWECGMTSMFSQAQSIPVTPKNGQHAHLTLEDIIGHVVLDDGDTHKAPTRLIALENTHAGKVMPLNEVKKIAKFARTQNIWLHLDGARLWNACYGPSNTAANADSAEPLLDNTAREASISAQRLLRDYCRLVDSVSLCFSKSLGAPSGSILLSHDPHFIQRARHFRKALGGGLRQTGVLTAPARFAINVFLSGRDLPYANRIAKEIQDAWTSRGGKIQSGLNQETNMVWLDLNEAGITADNFIQTAKEEGVRLTGGRIVTHYQIAEEAIWALNRIFERLLVKQR